MEKIKSTSKRYLKRLSFAMNSKIPENVKKSSTIYFAVLVSLDIGEDIMINEFETKFHRR